MDNLETPLIGSRTLHSASTARLTASVSSSARRINSDGTRSLYTPGLLRRPTSRSDLSGAPGQSAVAAAASRLPTRTDVSILATAPRTAGSLKRKPSAAGLSSNDNEELVTTRRQLNRALQEVEDLKIAHEKALVEARRETASLRTANEEQLVRIEQLEKHRATLMTREREIEEREADTRKEYERKQNQLEREQKQLVKQLDQVRAELDDSQVQYRQLEHASAQAKRQAKEYISHVRALESEVVKLGEERSEVEKRLVGERDRRLVAEDKLAKARLHVHKESKDDLVIREELHRQVSHLKVLEKENSKLLRRLETFEKQHENVDVVKETIKSLEKQVKVMDSLRDQLAASQAQVDQLKREQREWAAFLNPSDVDPVSTPRKLTKTLAATRIENASFRQALDTRELEVERRDRIIGELEQRVQQLSSDVELKQREVAKEHEQSKRESHRVKLLSAELDMLRKHLESYNAEEVMHNSESMDNLKNARIQQLEELLEAHRRELHEVSDQLNHYKGLVERYGGNTTEIVELEKRQDNQAPDAVVQKSLEVSLRENEDLRAQIETLQNEVQLLEKELDGLEQENDRLAADGMVGFNPSKIKVLELRVNPDTQEHAIRTSTLERLRAENAALLKRIDELQAMKGASHGSLDQSSASVPRESYVSLQAELEAKNQALKQKEILEQRIKQAFSAKADEFRLAVLSLLGYRLDFEPGARVKVSSIYAPSKEHSLLFRSSTGVAGGPMELIGAGSDQHHVLTDDVRSQIKFWIGERKSIPGFMASMTLTLFEETTKGSGAGFISAS